MAVLVVMLVLALMPGAAGQTGGGRSQARVAMASLSRPSILTDNSCQPCPSSSPTATNNGAQNSRPHSLISEAFVCV